MAAICNSARTMVTLYIGMGDGGGGGDQHGTIGNGQNPAALLGKMLRFNVRGVPTYTIPAEQSVYADGGLSAGNLGVGPAQSVALLVRSG